MQLSRFVVTYENVRPGENVLYSVLDDRYLGLDENTLAAVRRWSVGGAAADAIESETQQVLLDDGFLVESRSVDDVRLRAQLDKAAQGYPGTMFVTLMPTLACNLACNYCFQKDSPAFNTMHKPTEAATLEWILRTVDERSLSKLHVHYFGGEPLTRKGFCLRTAEALGASMRARGGTFEWSMTTNGIGLDVEFAKSMLACGPGGFKVTLDGDQETHDQMRVWRDGKGTFEQIFAAVEAVAPHAKIRIGGNFLPHQAASFERLLERIEASGLGKLLDGVVFKPIIDVQLQKSSCTGCGDNQQETKTLVQLNKAIDKKGLGLKRFERDTLESLLGPCELHWKNNYTIDPDGYVYKCPAVAGRQALAVTQVSESAREKIAPLLASRPWEQCGDCAYLSVCVGGCLGGKYLSTGRTDQVLCRKEQFEKSFRETVSRRYLEEFSSDSQWNNAA